jgi:hypothetical protein
MESMEAAKMFEAEQRMRSKVSAYCDADQRARMMTNHTQEEIAAGAPLLSDILEIIMGAGCNERV